MAASRVSYNPFYKVDYSDQAFPTIRYYPDCDDGKTFGAAVEELKETIRNRRDHWVEALRAAKNLTIDDIE